MRRDEGAQTPFEVYCYRCRVTFPVGTRSCIHCGGRVGRPGPAAGEARPGESDPTSGDPDVLVEEEEEGALLMARRFGGLGIWALLALGAVLSNLCQGG